MTNLGVLFEEARKKYGFNNKNGSKGVKHYPTDHKKSKLSSTGLYNVKRLKSSMYQQGFCYIYRFNRKEKYRQLSSVDILKLKRKVLNAGGEWYILDEEKALDLANYHDIEIEALV